MEKVILKEKISGDTKNNKKYYNKKKPKNKVGVIVTEKDNKYGDLVLRSGEVYTSNMIKPPKHEGSYMIGHNVFVYLQKKPKSIHRFFTKLLLGWVWKDVK